jgi:hemerythrin superfamily protein
LNLIELLMVEHVSLRLHFQFARKSSWDSIYEIEEFVRNCHARVEDEVVFPKIKELLNAPDKEGLLKIISRLEADHKLIGTIGEQIRQRTAEGDYEVLQKRILLYATTVESHNSNEESLIFPYWNPRDAETNTIVRNQAMKIISEFGLNRYLQTTGISEKLLGMS